MSIYMSVNVSVFPAEQIYLSIYLYICLSVCLSVFSKETGGGWVGEHNI